METSCRMLLESMVLRGMGQEDKCSSFLFLLFLVAIRIKTGKI